jgi:uncharacterized protein (DUF885 family)
MTDANLKKLADANTQIFFEAFEKCNNASDVERLLKSLKSNVAPELFEAVIDRVELQLSDEIIHTPAQMKNAIKLALSIADTAKSDRSLKDDFRLKALEEDNSLEPLVHVMSKIAEIKGDKAGAVSKAFSEEVAKLSDAQYTSSIEQARLIMAVSDRFSSPSSPKKNPFKKPDNKP